MWLAGTLRPRWTTRAPRWRPLYWQKGRGGGSGAYRGARWHSTGEVRALFSGLPVRKLKLRSAIFLPSATRTARCLERAIPGALPWGGLLLATGENA
jgi:hypothetical protein